MYFFMGEWKEWGDGVFEGMGWRLGRGEFQGCRLIIYDMVVFCIWGYLVVDLGYIGYNIMAYTV